MDGLETLVRDTLAAHEPQAPEADRLLGAVRGGVARRRRLRTSAACAGVAAVAVAVAVVLANLGPGEPGEPGLRQFAGHNPPVPPASILARRPAPAPVREFARIMSSRWFGPHLPATATWVATTVNTWLAAQHEPLRAVDQPVYVIQLRFTAPTRCLACDGLVPIYARYGVVVVTADGRGTADFNASTGTGFSLERFGPVIVLGYDY